MAYEIVRYDYSPFGLKFYIKSVDGKLLAEVVDESFARQIAALPEMLDALRLALAETRFQSSHYARNVALAAEAALALAEKGPQ